MSAKMILILGGGWGGLTAAHQVRSLVPSEHRVVVIERSTTFSLGLSNLGLMTGERVLPDTRRDMAKLKHQGIEWVHAEVLGVDPEALTVKTDSGTFSGEYVVLAMGAELAPESIPGFSESAFNLYEATEAAALHDELERFDGGRIVILVAGAPFQCPAAPYEAAMLIEAWTRANDIRDRIEIDLYTPESIPMAVAGPAVGQGLSAMLDERGITQHFDRQVTAIDRVSDTLRFDGYEAPYDLLIGIPPHRPPAVLRKAGLVDGDGFLPTHPQTLEILSDEDTLEVQFPGLYAIGDLAAIRLLNSALLPKAGVFAEAEAQVVAAAIAADINGTTRPRVYDGHGFCYVDVGDGLAAHGSGNFYAFPGPRINLEEPSVAGRRAKLEYEHLLDTWFNAS